MQLSEAIRLGAMMKPQTFFAEYDGRGTCANGAALDAIGKLEGRRHDALCVAFPVATTPCVRCHACAGKRVGAFRLFSQTLGGLIAHLNDEHRWTREQIADFVETIEQARDTPADVCVHAIKV